MVACPDLVDLDALGQRTFPPQPGPQVGVAVTSVDWISRHPEMAVGEPQKATRAKGHEIAKLWSDAIIRHLQLIKRDEIVPRTLVSYARRAHSVGGTSP